MKKILFIFLITLSISFFLASGALAYTCVCICKTDGTSEKITEKDYNTAMTQCSAICEKKTTGQGYVCEPYGADSSGTQIELKDPLNLKGDPTELYARVIRSLLGFIGVASLVTFVYAGFMFLTSAGNQERIKKAKDTMLYGILGVAVSIASYAILNFIFKALEGATGQL